MSEKISFTAFGKEIVFKHETRYWKDVWKGSYSIYNKDYQAVESGTIVSPAKAEIVAQSVDGSRGIYDIHPHNKFRLDTYPKTEYDGTIQGRGTGVGGDRWLLGIQYPSLDIENTTYTPPELPEILATLVTEHGWTIEPATVQLLGMVGITLANSNG